MKDSNGEDISFEKLLARPCERVQVYPSLLKELLTATPKNHPDYQILEKVIVMIQDLISNLENERRIIENNIKVLKIEESIEGVGVSNPS
jgi:hypothetical protein